jgi:hypothetical protein
MERVSGYVEGGKTVLRPDLGAIAVYDRRVTSELLDAVHRFLSTGTTAAVPGSCSA